MLNRPAKPTRVLHLKGSDREIGRQHAETLREEVREGMLRFYVEFFQRVANRTTKSLWDSWKVRATKKLVDPVLVNQLMRQVPAYAEERVLGLGEGADLSMKDLRLALVLPDMLPILQAYWARLQPSTFVAPRFPSFGCSSFLANGERFFHGRNLDFPGVSYWDRFPVIQMTERPTGQRFISFTTAGVPMGGITGVNESQVSVALHQHYTRQASLGGKLPYLIAEEILHSAGNAQDAIRILRSQKVASSWAFLVTDGKSREAFIYESQPKASGVRWLGKDKVLAHSNYYQVAACKRGELAVSARMNWDNYARRARIQGLVEGHGPGLTVPQACKALSDHVDPYWGEEKLVNRLVSQAYNIQSLLLDTENMRVYMAEGDAPIHLGDYAEFDLGAIFDGREGRTGERVEGFRYADSQKEQAMRHYITSFVAGMGGEYAVATKALSESVEHYATPESLLTLAVLEMKSGDLEGALQKLHRSVEWVETKMTAQGKDQPPPEYFECLIYLARNYDLLGNRAAAKKAYAQVAEHPKLQDAHLAKIARKQGPFTAGALEKIFLPYSTYVPFE